MKGTPVTANSQPVAESDGLRLEIQSLQTRLLRIAVIARGRAQCAVNRWGIAVVMREIQRIAEGR